jgi:hypothetical protein
MERPLLNDPTEFPNDGVLAAHLGKTKPLFDAFSCGVARRFDDATLEWRYYKDGKAWLCKVVRKKKTLCWLSAWDKFFKTAFYFTARSDKDIAALPIPSDLKDAYREHAPIGKLKPLVIEVKTKKALEAAFVVVEYKSGLK